MNTALVESRRTASGPRQHTVATLQASGLDEKVQAVDAMEICWKAALRQAA